ncbi:3',5'-cyclic-nucleotide phosphodiesterase [Cichlidogyrus casuarinus]|uniref:3',5'-cyclic-nucleotide phosphodiesterase n=1 Tax=Cichlidogyrus casuarinus TaxID=1844966 RepID=A0ABD2Q7A4_9PLAT
MFIEASDRELMSVSVSPVQYANYLNWLNAPMSSNRGNAAVTGLWAPPPNPNMAEIRPGDVELRRILALHERAEFSGINESGFCSEASFEVSEQTRMELRTAEFNNWSHNDAQLMRYLRDMYVELNLTEPHMPVKTAELDRWLAAVYRRYNQVPFHNFKHAFMVAQMSYAIIWTADLNKHMTKLDQIVLITAAISHDLDHPGFNNAYQINAGTQLAIRYNDRSPLENHHASTTFEVLYGGGELNPFRHLGPARLTQLREGIIRFVTTAGLLRHQIKLRIVSKYIQIHHG